MEDTEKRIRALRKAADWLEKEMRMVDDLQNCPFCGGKPRILEIGPAWGAMGFPGENDFSVVCTNCGCRTKEYKDKKSAVWSWSRRVSGPDGY